MAATGDELVTLSQYKTGVEGYVSSDAVLATDIKNGTVRFASDEDFCAFMGIEYVLKIEAVASGMTIVEQSVKEQFDTDTSLEPPVSMELVIIDATLKLNEDYSANSVVFTLPEKCWPKANRLNQNAGNYIQEVTVERLQWRGQVSANIYTDGTVTFNENIPSISTVSLYMTYLLDSYTADEQS